jgi:tetratricopeptide (TPR) repeat protein
MEKAPAFPVNIRIDRRPTIRLPKPSTSALFRWEKALQDRAGTRAGGVQQRSLFHAKDRLPNGWRSFIFVPDMKRQRLVSRGSLSRLFEEAAEAWRKQEYQAAIELLQRASHRDPANPSILLDLGRAHGLRYDYPAAEHCLEKAVRVSPRKTETLAEAARRCQEFGHYPMATSFFARAAQQEDATADALATLAELYERHHRLDDATDLLGRALRLQPAHPRAVLGQARLKRQAGDVAEAERLVRTLTVNSKCDPSTRIRAWYELGNLLDRAGHYQEAMAAFLEAKAIQRPAAEPFLKVLQGVQARVRELEQTVSAGVLKRWSEAAGDLQPSRRLAVLCGHPRSGTTLLEHMLDAHPGIVSAEETHILHDEAYLSLTRGFPQSASVLEVLDSAPPSRLRQSRDDYFRFTELFVGKRIGDKLLIDKNPALNVLIPAVVRIFPEARFLIALRDPRDVCLSCFMQPLALNPVSSAYLSLEGTVNQYASVMGLWRSILPKLPNPPIEVRYEDLVNDIETESRRVLEFLGVSWDPAVLQFHEHARRKPVRSPSYADVVKPVYKRAVGRWRNYAEYFGPGLEKLGPFVTALGYGLA